MRLMPVICDAQRQGGCFLCPFFPPAPNPHLEAPLQTKEPCAACVPVHATSVTFSRIWERPLVPAKDEAAVVPAALSRQRDSQERPNLSGRITFVTAIDQEQRSRKAKSPTQFRKPLSVLTHVQPPAAAVRDRPCWSFCCRNPAQGRACTATLAFPGPLILTCAPP